MKKTVLFLLSIVTVLLAFSACDSGSLIRPADSLLTPPIYYDEYEGLVEVFRSSVGSDATFCNPFSGIYRSAITVADVDGDGNNEAVIFYKKKTASDINNQLIKMHYFDYLDGEWISAGEVDGHGDGVESFSFTDMNGDGFSEIFVSWSTSSVSSGSYISLYRFDLSSLIFTEVFGENCLAHLLIDVDGDLLDDVFYINQSVVMDVGQKNARVIGLSGDSVVIHGESKLDPNISRYTLTVPEKHADNGVLSVYIDALKGEHQMITEFLYWDSEKSELCNPLLNVDTMSNTKTFRYESISSEDINGDGKIDIPAQTPLVQTGPEPNENEIALANEIGESVYLTTWKNFSFDASETIVAYTLVNVNDGYMIYLSEEETQTISITAYPDRNCWVVYKRDSVTGESEEIYSVLRIKNGSTEETLNGQYIPVIEKDDETVYVYITENGRANGIDEKTVREKITKIP